MRIVSEPITKITLNLYTRDVEWFKRRFPSGYTERLREVVRDYIKFIEQMEEDE
jgi:phosphopentomutase